MSDINLVTAAESPGRATGPRRSDRLGKPRSLAADAWLVLRRNKIFWIAGILVALVLLLLGITLVTFVLTQIVPSNAAATALGEQAAGDPAAVKAFNEHYGLDKPLPQRYLIYLGHLVQGDLGQSSVTHNAVSHDLEQFIPATAELALFSIVIASVIGVGFGVLAALRRNKPTDHTLRVT